MTKLTKRYALPALAFSAAAALAYCLVPGKSRVVRGQVVIITGGSSGLGLALAHRFGRAGCKLVLASLKEEELDKARQELLQSGDVRDEDDILLVAADLSERDQAAGVMYAAVNAFGQVDILINNAGIMEVGPAEDLQVETFEKTMQTDFFAALYTVYAALPGFLRQGSGAIVNICSIGGKIPVPHMLPYVAAKFALTGFSETLHTELRQKNIRVTTVCPGLMRTGGEAHAHFYGNVAAEKEWFTLAATTPVLAADVHHAADRIFNATNAGRTEITITPQAWLAARVFGLMPETTQAVTSLVNRYVLPAPAGVTANERHAGHYQEDHEEAHYHDEEPSADLVADPSPS